MEINTVGGRVRQFLASVTIVITTTVVVGTGMALAADLDIAPANPAAGETELTIDVWDFDPDTAIFAVPCQMPEPGAQVDTAGDACDISEVTTATTNTDGKATIIVTWDIPEDGIAVYVSDERRQNQATQVLATNPPAAAAETTTVQVLGTTIAQEDLAETGARETMILVMIAATLLAIGTASKGLGRQLTPARERS